MNRVYPASLIILAPVVAGALFFLAPVFAGGKKVPHAPSGAPGGGATVMVVATAETAPVPHGDDAADDPAIWVHPTDPSLSTIIGADKKGGLAVYDLSGKQLQYLADGNMNNVDLRANFPLGGRAVALVAATNRSDDSIAVYRINPATRHLENAAARPIRSEMHVYGLCMHRSPTTGKYYVFSTGGTGAVEQWELFDDGRGRVDGRKVRTFVVGSQTEGCVVDDKGGHLYLAEEKVGIWKYGAEPDAGATRTQVDSTGSDGHLTADVEGLALYDAGNGTGYLIASSQGNNSFVVYGREAGNAYVGTFAIGAGRGIDAVEETDGIDVTSAPLGPSFPQGLFVAQNGRNDGGNQNFTLVSWDAIAKGMGPALLAAPASPHPQMQRTSPVVAAAPVAVAQRSSAAGAPGGGTTVMVVATAETAPVPHADDAADDPAIWVHPTDPSLSTIIGTDKDGGVAVYDLSGKQLQYLADGEINNVDLRANFPLGGQAVALVAATNTSDDSIAVYRVNPATRQLENAAARPIRSEMRGVYGLCMHRSRTTGKYYAFATSKAGAVEQWELFDDGRGRVDGRKVRTFSVGSQTEGCVVDDERGDLYLAEEEVGIWKYGAEPDAGDTRTRVDSTGPDGHLTADVEGLAIYDAGNGTGYLIASSQGNNSFVVYSREAGNAYVGTFAIGAGRGIDAVEDTDGIEVTSASLGPSFPQGLFVAQNGRNDGGNQNFTLVSWDAIAKAMGPVLLAGPSSPEPRTERTSPVVAAAPVPAPAAENPQDVVRVKELRADRVRARFIYAKEVKAEGGVVGRVIAGETVQMERPGTDKKMHRSEVVADVIYAKEIKARWLEAGEIHAKEVEMGDGG